MGQLVKAYQRYLGTLVVEDGHIVLQVSELDLHPGCKLPVEESFPRSCPKICVHLLGFIPQATLVSYLGGIAPENNSTKIRIIIVSQRFEQQSIAFATTGSTSVDANICLAR